MAATKQYLSYFQGSLPTWECDDQRRLRHVIPENRLRVYDVRQVIETMADVGSVLELRRGFGLGMVTSLIRIEGRAVGLIANNPGYLSGAVDSDGADKAARFMQLCDAFDIPILILCDTPGMMVGPEIEKTALVRHCNRLFVVGANLSVPTVMIVLRKGYGLGAQAMAGGSFKEPFSVGAWPTAEFGGMGLEGQVKLGFRNELAAMDDPDARRARYDQLVASGLRAGQGHPGRRVVPGRRRHRPGRLAPLRGQGAGLDPAAGAAGGQEAPVRRRVVSDRDVTARWCAVSRAGGGVPVRTHR